MLKSKPRPATYADIEALPHDEIGEIIFGTLRTHRFLPITGFTIARMNGELGLFGRQSGRWEILNRPELHLGPHVVVPDLAGWKRERLPPFPDTAYIEAPPDWLCEVLSPSTQALDRTDKLAVYAEFGVKHCWYVDPIARTLEVLALDGGKWRIEATFKNDDAVAAPPFEVHTFGLDGLWV